MRIRRTQKEADALMILCVVVALGHLGNIVAIYFSDTYVLVLALRRVPELMMDTGAK